MKATRNPETGLYLPIHPCYKKPDQLCKLRELPDSNFQCVIKDPEHCSYRAKKKEEQGKLK